MKIAFYCPNKPLAHPNPSGDLTIARGLFRALDRLGHDIREVPPFRSRWFWKSPRGWYGAAAHMVRSLGFCARFKPHVWLTYHTYYKSPDLTGPLLCRLLRIPYVLFQPMYATKWRKRQETRVGFYLNRLAIKVAAHLFINNRNDDEALTRLIGPRCLTYIPPGIFADDFVRDPAAGATLRTSLGISPLTPLLLTVCRFRPGVKTRSLEYLFSSLGHLAEWSLPFTLLVVGDGPSEPHIRRLSERLLPGRVLFAGRVPREETPRYYSAADVFVFPGIGESLGMVYLEAQACGLPVVALRTGGVPQVVREGVTGILVEEDAGRALARAVRTLLTTPSMRAEMGANAARMVREAYDLGCNYRDFAAHLEEVVSSSSLLRRSTPAP